MLRNKMEAQIATILTLIMAVIFLFIVITINIGNIAQEKTMVSNASDGAALILASMLGSLANALKIKLELYGDKVENCDVDWALLTSIIILIMAVVLPPVGGALAVIVTIAGVALSAGVFGLGMYNALVGEPGVFKKFELKFQNMTLEQRMKEKAIQYAFFAIVTDPNKICTNDGKIYYPGQPNDPTKPEGLRGRCSDPNDLDMDGDITDCIHWFSKWYNERLTALPRVGDIVENLYRTIFDRNFGSGKSPRFYVWEDPQTWQPKKEEYGFWVDTNYNDQVDSKVGSSLIPEQGSLKPLDISSDDTHNPQGIIYAHDIYFTDWLGQRFIPLVQRLYAYEYGLYRDKGVKTAVKEIEDLAEDIKDFQKELGQIYGTTFDSRIESFDEWIAFFYDPNKDDEWFDRMQGWLTKVNEWRSILATRTEEINICVGSCQALGPYKCGKAAGGEVCEQIYVPKTCTRTVEKTCTDPTGKPYDCSYPEEYECGDCDPPKGWCNCRNGSRIDGGRLCPSGHCAPTDKCIAPITGESKHCCEIADNGLYYQLCDATPDSSGGNDAQCGASTCSDTYYQCDYNPDNNVITREHALNYLQQLLDDVTTIRNAFETAYRDKKSRENDPKAYEALYEWDDRVAKGEVGEQLVHHMVYVKLDKNSFKSYTTMPLLHIDVPDREYAIPHVHNKRELLVGKCAEVVSSKGAFNITVARYDQDIGAQSPLKNLWLFKTRGKALEGAPIGPGSSTVADANPTITPYTDKVNFVLKNGIVSQTEGHYGPGDVYTKAELESWSTEAQKRNKDIYIKRLK